MSPARAAVVGHPIGHSRSPDLHRAAYAVLGEDVHYDAHDLVEEQKNKRSPAAVDASGVRRPVMFQEPRVVSDTTVA